MKNIKIVKTTEEFNLPTEKLQEVKNEYGYTKEENLLLDHGLKINFYSDMKHFEKMKEDIEESMSYTRLELKGVYEMTDNRIAVVMY